MPLVAERCRPCEGGVPPLSPAETARLHAEIPSWELAGDRLRRRLVFDDFGASIGFLVQVGMLAEREGHHPDFTVHYRRVDLELWTHAIGGLSENDFILAAKIDALMEERRRPDSNR